MALTIAGVFSTVALVASLLLAATVATIVAALHFPRARTWLADRVTTVLGGSSRQTFPLAEVAEAHRVSEQGQVRGKLSRA